MACSCILRSHLFFLVTLSLAYVIYRQGAHVNLLVAFTIVQINSLFTMLEPVWWSLFNQNKTKQHSHIEAFINRLCHSKFENVDYERSSWSSFHPGHWKDGWSKIWDLINALLFPLQNLQQSPNIYLCICNWVPLCVIFVWACAGCVRYSGGTGPGDVWIL